MSLGDPEDRNRLGILVLLSILFLAPSLFSSKVLLPLDLLTHYLPWAAGVEPTPVNNPILSDQAEESLPYHALLRRSLLKGTFPFWNPYSALGTPLSGVPTAALFSPFSWLLMPLPEDTFFEYRALLILILAGSGIYLFCRRLGAGPDASLAAAVAYQFGGYTVYTLGYPSGDSSAFLGWEFLFCELLIERKRKSVALGLVLTLAASYLGGQLQVAFFQHLALAVYVLVRRPVRFGAFSFLSLLALGTASVGWLPFVLHLLQEVDMGQTETVRQAVFLPLSSLLHFLIPNYQGSVGGFFDAAAKSSGSFLYIGILPLGLALVALRKSTKGARLALGTIALISLLFLCGVPPLPFLLSFLPLLKFANYLHFVQPLLGVCCVLAGLGLQDLVSRRNHEVGWLLIGLLTLNGFLWGAGFNTTASREVLERRPEVLTRMQEEEHGRVLFLGEGVMPPNTSILYGIRDPRGYQAIQMERYRNFMSAWLKEGTNFHYFVDPNVLNLADTTLVRRLGCSLILSPTPLESPGLQPLVPDFPYLYRVSGAARAEFASGVVPATEAGQALQGILDSETAAGSIFLEAPLGSPSFSTSGTVSWLVDLPNQVSLQVRNENAAWLVLRDSYHPNWRAFVDGDQVPIERADYLFRAVHVPAGTHRVDFYYLPIWLGWGALASLVSFALTCLLRFGSD